MAKSEPTTDAMNDLDDYLDQVDENGFHHCQIAGIRFQSGRDGRNWVVFKFEVTDLSSPLAGEEYERWIQDWSHLNTDDYNGLKAKEKSAVRMAKKRLFDTLVACGFSEDEAKEVRRNPKSDLRNQIKGNRVWVEVSVSENNGREYKNVNKIMPVIEDDGNLANPPF